MRVFILGALLSLLAVLCAAAQSDQDNSSAQPAEQGTPVEEVTPGTTGTTPSTVAPPDLPALDEIRRLKQEELPPYIPLEMNFRIGIIGEHSITIDTTIGPQSQIKTPLILVNPATGESNAYAQNFPARVAATAPNGSWVIGIAPSATVDGSSGSAERECAVSLNLVDNSLAMICEFPLHSNFQAYFLPNSNDFFYYCVNEPGAVNQIVKYDLKKRAAVPVPAEGNRFIMYGPKTGTPTGMWVKDPMSLADYPVLSLVGLDKGDVMNSVRFPGSRDIVARSDGSYLLASVVRGAEASLGYFQVADKTYHQVPQLVFTRPSFKWLNKRTAVIAKESTVTKDRFLLVELPGGETRELISGYFKVDYWDISPNDEALVFVTGSKEVPVLFVIPLDPSINVVNRIRLHDATNITWLGCLTPPPSGSRGSWLNRLLPF